MFSEVSVLQVASYAASGLLAASKLFSLAKPLWGMLPRWAAVAMPVLVLDLPIVAGYIAGAHSEIALVSALATSVALLLPGLAEAEETSAPPMN